MGANPSRRALKQRAARYAQVGLTAPKPGDGKSFGDLLNQNADLLPRLPDVGVPTLCMQGEGAPPDSKVAAAYIIEDMGDYPVIH